VVEVALGLVPPWAVWVVDGPPLPDGIKKTKRTTAAAVATTATNQGGMLDRVGDPIRRARPRWVMSSGRNS
jgi:hypothetical protein